MKQQNMPYSSIVIIDARTNLYTVRIALEQRYDVAVRYTQDPAEGFTLVQSSRPDYILINPDDSPAAMTQFLSQLKQAGINTPVIVAGDEGVANQLRATYPNIVGRVPPVYSETDLMPILKRPRPTKTGRLRGMALAERAALVQANQLLQRRVQEVMTLHRIGKSVASLTDLDAILTRIVEAAVFLLRAEESSILLIDPETKALHLRAERGLGEKQAKGLNVRIQDTLIGSVVRTGRPVRLARGTTTDPRLKVVTGYLVNALLYVPLTLRGQVIGVLGTANQTTARAFSEHDQRLLEALADYAVLAIELARQYEALERLRQDLNVVHTISAALQDIRAQLLSDDSEVQSALRRIESAVHILTRLAETEAGDNV